MSPEQALGKPVDARTDLFSFGILLYEMCTGRSPFPGDTTGELLISIVQHVQLTPAQLNPDVPQGLARIIDRCLEKDRDLRYQHASEIRADLKEVQRNPLGEIARLHSLSGIWKKVIGPRIFRVRAIRGCCRGGARSASATAQSKPARYSHTATMAADLFRAVDSCRRAAGLFPDRSPARAEGHKLRAAHPRRSAQGPGRYRWFAAVSWFCQNHHLQRYQPASCRCLLRGASRCGFRRLPPPFSRLNVSPDGAEILVKDNQGTDYRGELWRLPILGGSPRRLGGLVGQDAAWSPDGKTLVYADGSELFLARNDGTEPRKLVSLTGRGFYPAWSPGGSKLRFTVIDDKTRGNSLWEVSAQGTNLHPLFPAWHNPADECCGKWTADGKYFVFESQGQIWALSEEGTFLHRSAGKPIQLTSSPLGLFTPLPSKDGKKLFVVGRSYRGELQRGESKSGSFAPFLSGISAEDVVFSKDGQWLAYVSYPEGILWRSKPDGTQKIQLSSAPLFAALPRWSPDGKQIVFYNYSVGEPGRIYVVSAHGGSSPATAAGRS